MANERRVAIVTGADSGIGKATAVELARTGHDVGITWHTDREGAEGAGYITGSSIVADGGLMLTAAVQ